GAWAGEAPGRKLRERASAAAAAQARHAAGPQPRVAPAPSRAPAAAAALPGAPNPLRVPVVHAAPPAARRAAAAPVVAAPVARPAARRSTPPAPARTPPAAASSAARSPGRSVRPVFADSNVREVLAALSDAISAKQVAHYVRSEFASVAVVPVSPQEKTRATDQDVKAATRAAPVATRSRAADEFKLIDDDRANIAVAALLHGRQQAAGNP